MTMTSERVEQAPVRPAVPPPREGRLGWAAALLGIGAAGWAIGAAAGHSPARILAASLAGAWALAAVLLARRGEPMAALMGLASVIGGVGVASTDVAPIAAGALPAVGLM